MNLSALEVALVQNLLRKASHKNMAGLHTLSVESESRSGVVELLDGGSIDEN